MKYRLLAFALVALAVIGSCCDQPEAVLGPRVNSQTEVSPQTTSETEVAKDEDGASLPPDDEPPLLLDDEPLLLLDDDASDDESVGPGADNSRCFVCHMNFMDEDVAVTHTKANIACRDCHGESDEHIADESWASGGNGTAPDRMFPKPDINPFCMGCHTKDKIDTVQHRPLFANMDKMVCTDCHGKHRITTPRKCKWK